MEPRPQPEQSLQSQRPLRAMWHVHMGGSTPAISACAFKYESSPLYQYMYKVKQSRDAALR